MEKIQMTEEQAREIISTAIGTLFSYHVNDGQHYIDNLKQSGYIRKTTVEEAEEEFEDKISRVTNNFIYGIENTIKKLDRLYVLFQELKSEIERLK